MSTGKAAPKAAGNRGKGRKPGVPNKVTASVKQALTEAFERNGGVKALLAWAKDNPTEFYKLWGRMLPQEQVHTGDPVNPVQHVHRVMRWGDTEIPL